MSSLKVKEARARINNVLDELDESVDICDEQYLNMELIKLPRDIITPINGLLDLSCSDWQLRRFTPYIMREIVSFDLYNENMGFELEMLFKATLTLSTVLPIFFTLR